ncbi:MAG: type I secretion C-terminal target domain-containing protein, partial [Klebsiella grimontii]|nr:type I secretion C-terminal target domain-containing protein [Klebsiella grimontii]
TTLTFDIDSPASLAVNDVVALNVATALATVNVPAIDTSGLNTSGKSSGSGVSASKLINFSVGADREMDTLSVNVNYTASGSVVNTVRIDSTVSIYHVLSDGSKVLVWQGTPTESLTTIIGATASATDTLTLTGVALSEGNYEMVLASKATATLDNFVTTPPNYTVGATIAGTTIDTATHYTVAGTNVSGNIQNGNNSGGTEDFHGVLYASYTVAGHTSSGSAESWTFHSNGSITTSDGSSVSATSVTIYGDYGNLTMANNGSYTYSLNAGLDVSTITHKEVFAYTVNDSNGGSSAATLTIDLHPQITGSVNGDDIHSTAYDDTFTLGIGADTVVYNLLADDNSGGNGGDTWKDFSVAQGDHIDVSALLVDWDGNSSSLGNYVTLSYVGNNTVVSIDRDGGAGDHQSTTLITLEGVHINSLNELIDTNNSN